MRTSWKIRSVLAGVPAVLAMLVVPAAAAAADTYADASRADNSGDCLTPATACKTISGVDGAVAKATAGSTVRVLPGTYVENITLPGGISLVADSGNPTISPTMGVAVNVTGGPAATIDGLTFSYSSTTANQPQLRLNDGAGSMVVTDNTFVDPMPTNGDNQAGIRTSAQGTPQITGNTFTGLWHGIEVLSPASGVPGVPLIEDNEISGTHDIGDGVQIVGTDSDMVTGPTTARLVDNLIHMPGAGQSTGVFVLDQSAFDNDPDGPPTGVTMERNTIIGGTNGIQDFGARGPFTLFGDVIAKTGSGITGGAGILANSVNNLGGELTLTNVNVVNQNNLGAEIGEIAHLRVDSSIFSHSILVDPPGTATCTITFSRGPTTTPGGNGCANFQTSAVPSFVNQATDDYHLTMAGNAALIDQGNPLAPPPGAVDFDGDPRAIDNDATCPLNPVREIGADELNPGIPFCPLPPTPPISGSSTSSQPAITGLRAAALKKCKKKRSKQARKRCKRRAKLLPV
jgi:Right handed beta helix region